MTKSKITFEGIQIKSLEKARIFAEALNTIEIECGVKSVRITIKDLFLCPEINLKDLNKTTMERLLQKIFKDIRSQS